MRIQDNSDLTVFIVTQFLSEANRRVYQLRGLGEAVGRAVFVHQQTPTEPLHPGAISVRKWPNPGRILDHMGLQRARRSVDRVLYFPSPNILYVRPSLRALERAVRLEHERGHRVAVITAVPPHDLVLVGQRLKERHPDIRWIIDWADLWTYDINYRRYVAPARRSRIRELEARVMQTCDMNVVTNPWAGRVMKERYGIEGRRVTDIPHAYLGASSQTPEWGRVHGGEGPGRDGPIRLGYLGNLLKPPRVPGERLLDALALVRRSGLDVRLKVIGDRTLQRRAGEFRQHADWLEIIPRMPHPKALAELHGCDFALVLLSDAEENRAVAPMKIPFYLAMRLPTVAIVPSPSAAADLIQRSGGGYVLPSGGDWVAGFQDLLTDATRPAATFDEAEIEHYAWSKVAPRWLDVLDPPARGAHPMIAKDRDR